MTCSYVNPANFTTTNRKIGKQWSKTKQTIGKTLSRAHPDCWTESDLQCCVHFSMPLRRHWIILNCDAYSQRGFLSKWFFPATERMSCFVADPTRCGGRTLPFFQNKWSRHIPVSLPSLCSSQRCLVISLRRDLGLLFQGEAPCHVAHTFLNVANAVNDVKDYINKRRSQNQRQLWMSSLSLSVVSLHYLTIADCQ